MYICIYIYIHTYMYIHTCIYVLLLVVITSVTTKYYQPGALGALGGGPSLGVV